ncbi:MAG: hypothetical protein ACT4PI_02980 [Actinomycetota bacterium]
MANENLKRLAPLTGVLFVVFVFVSFAIQGDPPGADEGAGEIAEWYTDHEGQTIFAALLASLGAASLVFFAATVRRALRRTEQAMGVLSMAAFGGGVVAATGVATDSALRFTLADSADEIRPVAVQALHAFWEGFFFPMVVGVGVLVLATSLAALKTQVIPVWLAWIGILIFVVFFTPAGFIAFVVSALWILVVSVLLWRQEPAAASV